MCCQHHPSILCEFHMKLVNSFMPIIFSSLCLHYFLTEKLMMMLLVQQHRMKANLTQLQFVVELLKRRTGLKAKLKILWVGEERERRRNTDHYALQQCEKWGAKKFLETRGKSRIRFQFCKGLCEILGNGHSGYLPPFSPCTCPCQT